MKAKTHPQYFETIVTCACGNTFTTGSTKEKIEVEICSNCHPFYTGKQKLIDTAGVVDRFKAKLEKKKTIGAARADAAKKKAEKAAAKAAAATKEPASVKEKLAAARRTRGKVATTTSKKAGKASATK